MRFLTTILAYRRNPVGCLADDRKASDYSVLHRAIGQEGIAAGTARDIECVTRVNTHVLEQAQITRRQASPPTKESHVF